jgi:hypothetical protein
MDQLRHTGTGIHLSDTAPSHGDHLRDTGTNTHLEDTVQYHHNWTSSERQVQNICLRKPVASHYHLNQHRGTGTDTIYKYLFKLWSGSGLGKDILKANLKIILLLI